MANKKRVFEVGTLERVLEAVKQYGEAGASRSQVTERTGLEVKVVENALTRLTETGNVSRSGQKRGVKYAFLVALTVPTETVETSNVTVVNN